MAPLVHLPVESEQQVELERFLVGVGRPPQVELEEQGLVLGLSRPAQSPRVVRWLIVQRPQRERQPVAGQLLKLQRVRLVVLQ